MTTKEMKTARTTTDHDRQTQTASEGSDSNDLDDLKDLDDLRRDDHGFEESLASFSRLSSIVVTSF